MPLFMKRTAAYKPKRSEIVCADVQLFKKVREDKLVFRQYSVSSRSPAKIVTAVFMLFALVAWVFMLLKSTKLHLSADLTAIFYFMPVLFTAIVLQLGLDVMGSIVIDLNHGRVLIRNRGLIGYVHGPRPIYFDEIIDIIFTKKTEHGRHKTTFYLALINTDHLGEEELLRDQNGPIVKGFAKELSEITSKEIIDRIIGR